METGERKAEESEKKGPFRLKTLWRSSPAACQELTHRHGTGHYRCTQAGRQ